MRNMKNKRGEVGKKKEENGEKESGEEENL